MSFWTFSSRHKQFKFQSTIGTGATGINVAGCAPQGADRVSFGRMINALPFFCPSNTPPSGTDAVLGTPEIGDTEHRPFGSGMAWASGLDAQIHSANSNMTLSNRGIRARYDYYFWQGRDIWRYDSRIETSGNNDTFSQWTIDATPISNLADGQTLGLYQMLIGSGSLSDQTPYLCTAAINGSNQLVRIRKNLITGVWESGQIGTLTSPGTNKIPITEVMHNNKVYFITDQSDKLAIINFNNDTFTEISWPEQVRHPMDLNVFKGNVYCLNKTTVDNGVAIFRVDAALGMTKALTLDSGVANNTNNFRGRNMLLTCTVPQPIIGNTPHMAAFNFVSNQPIPTGSGQQVPVPSGGDDSVTASGMAVWLIGCSGNNSELYDIRIRHDTRKNYNQWTDAWAMGSNGQMYRFPYEFTVEPQANKSEDMVWRHRVSDLEVAESGSESIWITFRENPDDGAGARAYLYRNDILEDRMTFVTESHYFGGSHTSFSTDRFGGGQRDAEWGKFDVTISGVEDLTNGGTRVWFVVDGDYLYGDGLPLKISLRYGGQADELSSPHKKFASISGAISGTIVGNELYVGLSSGVPQYVDWNTIGDSLAHRGITNFLMHVSATGQHPEQPAIVQKQSAPVYFAINAEPFTFPTGPELQGRFLNPDPPFDAGSTGPGIRERLTQAQVLDFTLSTGPGIYDRFTNVSAESFSTGPGVYNRFTNVSTESFSTGPSTPIASGIWTFDTGDVVPTGVVSRLIWWGFRSSQRRISGFGRAQGI